MATGTAVPLLLAFCLESSRVRAVEALLNGYWSPRFEVVGNLPSRQPLTYCTQMRRNRTSSLWRLLLLKVLVANSSTCCSSDLLPCAANCSWVHFMYLHGAAGPCVAKISHSGTRKAQDLLTSAMLPVGRLLF